MLLLENELCPESTEGAGQGRARPADAPPHQDGLAGGGGTQIFSPSEREAGVRDKTQRGRGAENS